MNCTIMTALKQKHHKQYIIVVVISNICTCYKLDVNGKDRKLPCLNRVHHLSGCLYSPTIGIARIYDYESRFLDCQC